ncbi:MAG: antibiotic biosynthesis monooxygenase [Pyrinomonadaceae bacterium]
MNNSQTLNAKEQSIVTISAFTATGDLEQLRKALNKGLDAGLTVNEIKEVLVHLYAYCGFPRSLNAINKASRNSPQIAGENHRRQSKEITRNMNQIIVLFLVLIMMLTNYEAVYAQQKDMLVRISEIEIVPEHLDEYKGILKEESAASVKLEPGVIAIFPMFEKENPMQIRILEIYADRQAYESHLKTPHFQKYKTTTVKMVKSLKLVDMEAIDAETMTRIFKKRKR